MNESELISEYLQLENQINEIRLDISILSGNEKSFKQEELMNMQRKFRDVEIQLVGIRDSDLLQNKKSAVIETVRNVIKELTTTTTNISRDHNTIDRDAIYGYISYHIRQAFTQGNPPIINYLKDATSDFDPGPIIALLNSHLTQLENPLLFNFPLLKKCVDALQEDIRNLANT